MAHIRRSFSVSLNITHPSVDPDTISRELSLEATRQKKAGERRTTPSGSSLAGTYPFSSWGHEFGTERASELTDCLVAVLDRLEPHRSYFQDLVRDGGSIELFCGVFAEGNWDEILPHTLLRRLSEMAFDLRLDVYPNHDETP